MNVPASRHELAPESGVVVLRMYIGCNFSSNPTTTWNHQHITKQYTHFLVHDTAATVACAAIILNVTSVTVCTRKTKPTKPKMVPHK